VILILLVNFTSSSETLVGNPSSTVTSTRTPTPPILSLFPPLSYAVCVSLNGVVEPTSAGASITSVQLDWGDGTRALGSLPAVHNYTHTGTYTVIASATDSFGLKSSVSVTVRITGNETVSPPTLVLLPLSVDGNQVTVNGVLDYNRCGHGQQRAFVSWGDDGVQDVSVPEMLPASHVYSTNGIFNVCVYVTDTFSQEAQHCEQVMIRNVVGGGDGTGPTNVEVTVMDFDFKVVPNATVQMANAPDDQDLLGCMTDSTGQCEFSNVKPGEYFFVAIARGIGSRAEGALNVTAHHTGHVLALWNAPAVAGATASGLIPGEVGTLAAVVGAVAAAAGAIWEIVKKVRQTLRRRAEPP
jgi:hypothetical protein